MSRSSELQTVRIRVSATAPEAAEIAAAEAWEAGATGVVEEDGGVALTVYAPESVASQVCDALRVSPVGGISVELPEPVEDVVWSEAWKDHLKPVEVSTRLAVVPPFASFEAAPGQRVVTIDPGQAFGTGGHHSTRLALECMDACLLAVPSRRVLDVGTGSGVLAVAAVALGAGRAVGFDLDALAAPAARAAGDANGVAGKVDFFTGPLDALAGPAFDLIVANLLCAELLPLVADLAPRVERDGALVLAGLLDRDGPAIADAFGPLGFRETLRRVRRDEDGESWIGLVLRRGEDVTAAPGRASRAPGRRASR